MDKKYKNKLLILALCLGFFIVVRSHMNPENQSYANYARAENISPVLINEIAWMGTAASGNDEWLEIKNNTAEEIDLSGWTLKAASSSLDILLQGKLPASGFFLLERTDDDSVPNTAADQLYSGALSNAGLDLELRDASSSLVDMVEAASGWPAGDNENKSTMERSSDGGWKSSLLQGGTPKAENSDFENRSDEIIAPTVQSSDSAAATRATTSIISSAEGQTADIVYDYSDDIFISEIFPDPKGSDSAEFIELYNRSGREVDLNGWKITAGDRSYEIKAGGISDANIKPENYFLLRRQESKLILNNGGGSVSLFEPLRSVAKESIRYGKASENQSYAKDEKGEWRWSGQATPEGKNLFPIVNHIPKADFSSEGELKSGSLIFFDSSDTEDEDDDRLDFFWEFGDGAFAVSPSPEHAYSKAGNYKVKLSVSDGKATSSKEKNIKISPSAAAVETHLPSRTTKDVVINEILPDPSGEDSEEEWIELYNRSKEKISISGWRLDDQEGGSKQYIFPEDIYLDPESYRVIRRAESNLALNNNADEVRLSDGEGVLIEKIGYEKARENLSFARNKDDKFYWTEKLTPGKRNEIVNSLKKTGSSAKKKSAAKSKSKKISIQGIVMVEPGILGTQIFYLATPEGIQIYNYRKQFPKLKINDYIRVSGEAGESNGEKRIKTSSLEDIKILGKKPLPEPLALECIDLSDRHIGQLVKVTGEVTKKSGSTIYLDDETDEAAVYIKNAAGINKSEFVQGDRITVVGIANKTKSGLRILPRNPDDLKKIQSDRSVLGEKINNPLLIAPRNKKQELFDYLKIVIGGLAVVLFGLLIKYKKSKDEA